MRVAAVLAAVVISVSAFTAQAQSLDSISRFDGQITEMDYDLATQTFTPTLPGPETAPMVVYSNVAAGTSFYPPSATTPPTDAVMDWGAITTGGFNCITDFQIAYATNQLTPISITITFTTGATNTLGFGVKGTPVASFVLNGLPPSVSGGYEGYVINVNLSSVGLTFVLPDGDVGYLYGTMPSGTGPFLVGPPNPAGVEDVFDKYDATGAYISSSWFGGSPMASFYMEITGHSSYTPFGAACVGDGGFSPTISMGGCACPGETVSLNLVDAQGGAFAALAMDIALGSTTLPNGCTIDLAWPPFYLFMLGNLSGVGAGAGTFATTATLPMPSGPVLDLHLQILVKDTVAGLITSNGITLGIAP